MFLLPMSKKLDPALRANRPLERCKILVAAVGKHLLNALLVAFGNKHVDV